MYPHWSFNHQYLLVESISFPSHYLILNLVWFSLVQLCFFYLFILVWLLATLLFYCVSVIVIITPTDYSDFTITHSFSYLYQYSFIIWWVICIWHEFMYGFHPKMIQLLSTILHFCKFGLNDLPQFHISFKSTLKNSKLQTFVKSSTL